MMPANLRITIIAGFETSPASPPTQWRKNTFRLQTSDRLTARWSLEKDNEQCIAVYSRGVHDRFNERSTTTQHNPEGLYTNHSHAGEDRDPGHLIGVMLDIKANSHRAYVADIPRLHYSIP